MTAQHHPSTELLTSYAAGSLQLSQALCVASHIEMCPKCQQSYRRLQNLGAYMFGNLPPEAAPEQPRQTKSQAHQHLRHKVFDKIRSANDENPRATTPPAAKALVKSNVPRCLQQFIPDGFEKLQWKRLSPAIQQAHLCNDINGAQVALLKIKPGGTSGHHTHMGDEYTMVLKGAFSDETGIFQQGDFILRNSQHKHRPIATKDSECICLTVVEAPLQFTGLFTRWLNPLMRLTHPAYKRA